MSIRSNSSDGGRRKFFVNLFDIVRLASSPQINKLKYLGLAIFSMISAVRLNLFDIVRRPPTLIIKLQYIWGGGFFLRDSI